MILLSFAIIIIGLLVVGAAYRAGKVNEKSGQSPSADFRDTNEIGYSGHTSENNDTHHHNYHVQDHSHSSMHSHADGAGTAGANESESSTGSDYSTADYSSNDSTDYSSSDSTDFGSSDSSSFND